MFTPQNAAKNARWTHKGTPGLATPPISFSRELRQVLQERNLLTAKSRKKICSMLNDSVGGDTSSWSNNSGVLGTPTNEAPSQKRQKFRLQAIQEIVSSEKTYISQLEMLMQWFVRPLKEQMIIDDASHTALFGQVEMIHNLNGEFLQELQLNVEHVAQAFLKMAPFFKLYSVYAFDYRNALLILQELQSKNPVFRKFIEQTESRPEVQRKLISLMIVPIQRVPRYKLLLEQLLLYTSPAEADYKLLKESVQQIESIVSHINACVEDQEVTLMLINLQNSLVNRTPSIVKPSRKVIKEGVLQKITRNGTEIKRYCVLMSDIFMYCKILKERAPNTVLENALECCCIFPLKKTKVYELLPGNFKVSCQNTGIIFGTKDLQLGRAWVGFIRDAIDLHIQCRKTLRKDSSKRTLIRKKDMKKFESDYNLSPNRKKCDYDAIYRNRHTDSEDESEAAATNCFSRKKHEPLLREKQPAASITVQRKPTKRPAPPPPATTAGCLRAKQIAASATNATPGKRISNLYKKIVSGNENAPNGGLRGILKRGNTNSAAATQPPATSNSSENDAAYGFSNLHYANANSYFRTPGVDNTIPTSVQRSDLFGHDFGTAEQRDQLYPLRTSGGSNKGGGAATWSVPQHLSNNLHAAAPTQKKRVKFNDPQDTSYEHAVGVPTVPFVFPSEAAKSNKVSLRERVYAFFANLF